MASGVSKITIKNTGDSTVDVTPKKSEKSENLEKSPKSLNERGLKTKEEVIAERKAKAAEAKAKKGQLFFLVSF